MTEKVSFAEASKILQGYNDGLLELEKEWHDVGYSFPGVPSEECSQCGSSLDTPLSLDRDAYGALVRLRQRLSKAIRAYDSKAREER